MALALPPVLSTVRDRTRTGRPARLLAALAIAAPLAALPTAASAELPILTYELQGQGLYGAYTSWRMEMVAGDWDGDGVDTAGWIVDGVLTWVDRDGHPVGNAIVAQPGERVLVGDWDGDGDDTVGVRRGSTFLLSNSLSTRIDHVVPYGSWGDTPLVGDWDGDGDDTVGVHRGNIFLLRNSLTPGPADVVVYHGRGTDVPLVGDLNGDGRDDVIVQRGDVFHVNTSLVSGRTAMTLRFGAPSATTFTGDWDGDGTDEFGARR